MIEQIPAWILAALGKLTNPGYNRCHVDDKLQGAWQRVGAVARRRRDGVVSAQRMRTANARAAGNRGRDRPLSVAHRRCYPDAHVIAHAHANGDHTTHAHAHAHPNGAAAAHIHADG